MGDFAKAAAAVQIAIILSLLLSSRDKAWSSMLSMMVSAMVIMLGLSYLAPVLDFLRQLESLTGLQADMVKILLKACGIGILTEITVLLCSDAGNAALGQSLRILSSMVILWISLPLLQGLLELVREILEGM
jgi:stage III sporulation protein AD